MKPKIVLIIGQTPDVHIDRVCECLHGMGARTILFDRYDTQHLLALSLNRSGVSGFLSAGGESVDFEQITGVWWRWKPSVVSEYTGAFPNVASAFVSGEWEHVMHSLPCYLSHATWVNPLKQHYLMHRKPEQLALACDIGIEFPNTAFTNDPCAVLQMLHENQRLIYKPVKMFLVGANSVIYTNEVCETDVVEGDKSIRLAPGIFQQLIEKEYELRVTVVGEDVFAVKIDSQARESTVLDWRHSQLEDMYEVVSLDASVQRQLLEFHHRSGLVYGAYDYMIDKSGAAIFLECNPGGQWLWLEDKLGLKISECVASNLLR